MKVGIVGTGLIGASLGLALKRAHAQVVEVWGWDRDDACLARAYARGAMHQVAAGLEAIVREVDVCVLAVPLAETVAVARRILGHGAIVVSDVASVKQSIVAAIDSPKFVGAHPMAGSEHSGCEFARADLFDQAPCVLTPTTTTDRTALGLIEQLWRSVGAEPRLMMAEEHDAAVALTSHVPHACAFALAELFSRVRTHTPVQAAVGPAWRDMTRVAQSDPRQWAEILMANAKVPDVLDQFCAQLHAIRAAMRDGDSDAVARLLGE